MGAGASSQDYSRSIPELVEKLQPAYYIAHAVLEEKEWEAAKAAWTHVADNTSPLYVKLKESDPELGSKDCMQWYYDKFFELADKMDDSAQSVYKSDRKTRVQTFQGMMNMSVNIFEGGEEGRNERLDRVLSGIARSHCRMGVRAYQYPAVGEVLLLTFEHCLGEAWTAEAKEAWVKILSGILKVILPKAIEEEMKLLKISAPDAAPSDAPKTDSELPTVPAVDDVPTTATSEIVVEQAELHQQHDVPSASSDAAAGAAAAEPVHATQAAEGDGGDGSIVEVFTIHPPGEDDVVPFDASELDGEVESATGTLTDKIADVPAEAAREVSSVSVPPAAEPAEPAEPVEAAATVEEFTYGVEEQPVDSAASTAAGAEATTTVADATSVTNNATSEVDATTDVADVVDATTATDAAVVDATVATDAAVVDATAAIVEATDAAVVDATVATAAIVEATDAAVVDATVDATADAVVDATAAIVEATDAAVVDATVDATADAIVDATVATVDATVDATDAAADAATVDATVDATAAIVDATDAAVDVNAATVDATDATVEDATAAVSDDATSADAVGADAEDINSKADDVRDAASASVTDVVEGVVATA